MTADLHVHLDAPLPDALAVGGGTALFVAGWCVAGHGRIARLRFAVDGERVRQRLVEVDVQVGGHGVTAA